MEWPHWLRRRKTRIPFYETPAIRPIEKYIKVYQYQVELEGGRRVGPLWNHESEVATYLLKESFPQLNGRTKRVVQITDYILDTKFSKNVIPELVQIG